MSKEQVRFKRVPVCGVFAIGSARYRKASGTGAYRLNADGRGQTDRIVPVCKNTFVQTG